ncbi:MAG: hypothetical protein ACI4PH_04640, partial [Faecousia sp.]
AAKTKQYASNWRGQSVGLVGGVMTPPYDGFDWNWCGKRSFIPFSNILYILSTKLGYFMIE